MIAASVLALSLAAAPAPVERSRTVTLHAAGWTVRVYHDGFANRTRCAFQKGPVGATTGWVSLHLGRNVDTLGSEVRIDGASPRRITEFERPVVDPNDRSGDPILNPTGGRVVLPQTELVRAQTVWVRPASTQRVWRFDVTGLSQAMAAGAQAGCPG